jgi:hypothetical protein
MEGEGVGCDKLKYLECSACLEVHEKSAYGLTHKPIILKQLIGGGGGNRTPVRKSPE